MFGAFCRYRSCSDILRVCLVKKGKKEKKKEKKPRVLNYTLGKADATIVNAVYLALNFVMW